MQRNLLTITGTAPDHLVFRWADAAPKQTDEPAPSHMGRHPPAVESAPAHAGRHAPVAEPAPADVGDDKRALTRAELVSALLNLGCTRKEAQAATELAWRRVAPDASAEALVRGALTCLLPKHRVVRPHRDDDEI